MLKSDKIDIQSVLTLIRLINEKNVCFVIIDVI